MSTTMETRVPPDLPAGSSRWKVAAVIGVLVVLSAITVAVFAVTRDGGDGTAAVSSRQISATGRACQQWIDTSKPASGASSSGWCGRMTNWMNDQMASGRMTGPMMWGNPEAMRDTCRQAMTDVQPAAGNPAQWCGDMVEWMAQHEGDWDAWMMNPPGR